MNILIVMCKSSLKSENVQIYIHYGDFEDSTNPRLGKTRNTRIPTITWRLSEQARLK